MTDLPVCLGGAESPGVEFLGWEEGSDEVSPLAERFWPPVHLCHRMALKWGQSGGERCTGVEKQQRGQTLTLDEPLAGSTTGI